MRAGRTPPASSRRRPLRGAPPSPASWKPPDDPPWSGTHAATSAEGVRATARVLDEQLAELRDALARLTSVDDLARDGEPRVAPGNPRAGSAGAHERSERVMRTTTRADAMVKRAAATIAAHRKRVGGSTNPRADEACATALEELREASVELQRVHEKESVLREGERSKSDAREGKEASSARDDEPGTRPEPRDDRRRFGSDGRFGSRLRLRADVEPLLDAIERSVRRLRRDAKHVAAAFTREAKDGGGKGARRFPGFRSTRDSDGEDDGGASDVASEIFASSERSPPGAGGHEEASPKKQRSPLPSPLAQRWPPPSNPDPALVRELRLATETKERLARELDRASRASAATAEAAKRRDADAAVARAALEASHAEALRQARREAARWRAMYDAAREDLGAGAGAAEAEALREATRAAERRHRRELALLGAEHGNAHASLRRSLADAERRVADLEPALERSERRERELEERRRDALEENARLEADNAELRASASRWGRETAVAAEDVRAADARAAAEIGAAEEKYREELRARLDAERRLEEAGSDWRIVAAERIAAEARAARDDAREEIARLERELDAARRTAIEANARAGAGAMKSAIEGGEAA